MITNIFIYFYYNNDEYIDTFFEFNPRLTRVIKTRVVTKIVQSVQTINYQFSIRTFKKKKCCAAFRQKFR